MNQKGFAPVIVLLLVAGILVAGAIWYYVTPQSVSSQPASNLTIGSGMSLMEASTTTSTVPVVSTSSWLTYKDPQDRFSFQYPPACELNNSTYEGIEIISFYTCSVDGLAIDIYHKHSDQSVLDFWKGTTGLIVLSSTPMTIRGYPALQVEDQMAPFTEGDQAATSELLIMKDNTLIVGLAPSPFDALAHDSDPIPKAILNTLRF